MQIIDKGETRSWLNKRGLLDSTGMVSFSGFIEAISAAVPADSGRKTALSRLMASFFEADEEALLWINEFGIWPSSEDWSLFEGFRRSLGEQSPLYEKPGHIFSGKELRDVASLVAMTLYFIWGAILYSPAKGLAIKISHDEFVCIYVKTQKDASDILATLKRFFETEKKG